MRIGSLRKMIGFEYKGQVAYITRMDDFRDYMEPEVYEAVRKAFENGCDAEQGLVSGHPSEVLS